MIQKSFSKCQEQLEAELKYYETNRQKNYEKLEDNDKEELLNTIKEKDFTEAMGEGIWFNSIDKDYKTVNTDINYLGMLYKIMGEYFKKEEGKWKFRDAAIQQYKAIIEYFENPKYTIKEEDGVSEVVKCYAVLNKLSTAKNTKKDYVKVKQKFVQDVKTSEAKTFEYEVVNGDIKQKKETEDFDVIKDNQENLLSWDNEKWTTESKYKGTLTDKIEIKDPQSIVEVEMDKLDEQLKQKAEFLNSIISKYKRKGDLKKGLNESIKANKDIKIPFDRSQILRMKNFIGRYNFR